MNDDKTVRGVVQATAQNKPGRYGLKLAGDWFDGFGSSPVQKGDEVEVDYVENGRYRNIQKVRLVKKGDAVNAEPDAKELEAVPQTRNGESARDAQIARAVALKCATRLCEGSPAKVADVLDLAGKLEAWLRATPRRDRGQAGVIV